MINERTVFVLGAGASAPYGYPSGFKLKNEVLDYLEFESNNLVSFGYEIDLVKSFQESLFFSATTSVDAFLEHRYDEFLDIGKLSIARVLTKYEAPKALFEVYDWYQYLFDLMNAPFDKFGSNKVSFITFNYDRSLEHFFITALKNKYGKSRPTLYISVNENDNNKWREYDSFREMSGLYYPNSELKTIYGKKIKYQ